MIHSDKIKLLLLVLLLLSCTVTASTKDDLESAEEAYKAGYLTAKEYEIFKQERDQDLLQKPYGDIPLRGVYKLTLFDLYPGSEQPYHLEKEITVAEAIRLAMLARESAKIIESTNYEHPFKNVPAEYEKFVGYAYKNNLIPSTIVDKFDPTKNISFVQFECMMLKMLGYEEGKDFTEENIRELARKKGFGPAPLGTDVFIKAKAVEMLSYTLGVGMKGSHTIYIDYLISKKLISAKVEKFYSDQLYRRYTWDTRDNFSEVYWKYQRKYDFINFLDCRNGPAPIHPAVSWPDKKVTLEYAGYIKINAKDLDENFKYQLLEKILKDMEVKDIKIERAFTKVKKDGKGDIIDYYTRMIDIKERRNVVTIDVYLPYKK